MGAGNPIAANQSNLPQANMGAGSRYTMGSDFGIGLGGYGQDNTPENAEYQRATNAAARQGKYSTPPSQQFQPLIGWETVSSTSGGMQPPVGSPDLQRWNEQQGGGRSFSPVTQEEFINSPLANQWDSYEKYARNGSGISGPGAPPPPREGTIGFGNPFPDMPAPEGTIGFGNPFPDMPAPGTKMQSVDPYGMPAPSSDLNKSFGTNVNPNLATLGTGQTKNPYFGSTNPYITAAQATTMGNLYGAESATAANRVNQNTPYGSLEFIKGVDANGNPTWTANQTLSPQLKALTETSLAGLQSSLDNPMYGINPGQTYSDAILTRLQPQINQSNERLQAQLANQGIVPGTEAYNRAMTLQGQTTNDLLTSAITSGMQTGLAAQKLQNEQAGNIKALSTPGYVNPYSQAAVAGPDYLGAYTTSEAARIAQQNAANARLANTQAGLYGLGSALLMGGGGVGGLVNGIGSGLSGLATLGEKGYDWLSNLGGNPWIAQPDTGFAEEIATDYYGSTYDPLAGWSI